MQSDSLKRQFRTHLTVSFVLLALTLVPYLQVRNHAFVDLDDYDYLVENHHVKNGLTIEGLIWAFSFQHQDISYWRPLTWVSHMLDFELFGDDAGWHHLVNLMLHLLNVLLLYALFFRMSGRTMPGAIVAVLFAIHPINVESVAWVTERSNVLCTSAGLATLLLYVGYARHTSAARYMAVFLAFVLCVMVKPVLVTLPALMVLLDFWPLRRLDLAPAAQIGPQAIWSRLLREKALLLLVAIFAVWFALQRQGTTIPTEEVPWGLRLANAMVVYAQYLFNLVYPVNLTAFYPFPKSIPLWKSGGALILLISISVAAVVKIKQWPHLFVGWFWYMGTMLPQIGLVQAGLWPALADRWAYFPAIGLFMAFAWSCASFLEKRSHRERRWVLLPSLAAGTVLVWLAWVQVGYWSNSTRLFERMLTKTSGNFMAHNNLGVVLLNQGKWKEAETHFLNAIGINPRFELAFQNLGKVSSHQGDLERAEHYYRKALAIRPGSYSARLALGNLFFRSHRFNEAWQYYAEAIRIRPDGPNPYNGLGSILAKGGRFREAREMYQKALAIDPGHAAAKQNLERVLAALQVQADDVVPPGTADQN